MSTLKDKSKRFVRSKRFILAVLAAFVLAVPIFATANPDFVGPVQNNFARNGSGLNLRWVDNDNNDHLALDPAGNIRQEVRMILEFSAPDGVDFAAGDIEIRLPRALFEDRDDNLIVGDIIYAYAATGIASPQPHMEIPLPGSTDFDYTIDEATDEVVITNFATVTGGTSHLFVEFLVRYLPSQSPNGFTNDFNARATFAATHGIAPMVSNNLSLDLTTRVEVHSIGKGMQQSHSTWQPIWGTQPPGLDNHFFVTFSISRSMNLSTTQPFSMHLQDTPLDSGQIVAWTATHYSPPWTVGSTADFNNHADRTWSVEVPNGYIAGDPFMNMTPNTRGYIVVVAYPRDGQPSQTVRNSIQVALTPLDGTTETFIREASFTFHEGYLDYRGDAFEALKRMTGDRALVLTTALTALEADLGVGVTNSLGINQNIAPDNIPSEQWVTPGQLPGSNEPLTGVWRYLPAGAFRSSVRGFSFTDGGTQPFTTTALDDRVYLRNSTGFHLLDPGDYHFVHANVGFAYRELIPVVSSSGGLIETQVVPAADRSPIRIYAKTEADGWQHELTFNPANPALQQAFFPGTDVYALKAVHENGRYLVDFDIEFSLRLNPTPRVQSLIAGQETVEIANFSALIVEDYAGIHRNPVTPAQYGADWPGDLMARDMDDFGHLVQRAEHGVTLGRMAFATNAYKMIRWPSVISSDAANARMVFPYRLVANQDIGLPFYITNRFHSRHLSEELFRQLLPEQTEGVFYDLLPQGMIIDPETIVARDAMGRIVEHSLVTENNWQGSGRTMVTIYVTATAGPNFRNAASNVSISWVADPYYQLAGTGFSVDFDAYYPWANINLFGLSGRNLMSYQSRSGAFLSTTYDSGHQDGNPHTNASNTRGTFTAQERTWMANFPRTDGISPSERNTLSAVLPFTVDPVTADQIGFRKQVRAASDIDYDMETAIRPGAYYSYRLHYVSRDEPTHNLVLFDVLEAADNGRPTWRGTLQSVDVAQPEVLGIAPRVLYSTLVGIDPLNNAAHENIANTAVWSTTPPANLATVTAVAIDLTQGADGQPFVFPARSATVVNLHMKAPYDAPVEAIAFNRALYRVSGATVNWSVTQTPYTQVEMLAREIDFAKSSDPESGTQASPTGVRRGDTIEYSIVITNNEEAALIDINLEDTIPTHLSFVPSEIQGHFGAATPDYLANIARVSYSTSGNTIGWRLSTLGAGESFTLIVTTTVDPNLEGTAVFVNTARITHIGASAHDRVSNTTYHGIGALPTGLLVGVAAPFTTVAAVCAIATATLLINSAAKRRDREIEELARTAKGLTKY